MRKFSLYLAILALVLDAVAIIVGLLIAYQLRANGTELYYWPFNVYLNFILINLPFWLILLASQGLYKIRNLPLGYVAFGKVMMGLLSSWGLMLIVLYLWRTPQALAFPRLVIAYGIFLTFICIIIGRVIVSVVRKIFVSLGFNKIRTAILSPVDCKFVEEVKRSNDGRKVIAVIKENYLEELKTLKNEVDEIIISGTSINEKLVLEVINYAELNNISIILVPGVLTIRTTKVEMGSLAGQPIMHFLRTPLDGWGKVFKRFLDIILVLIGIAILSPIFLLTYLAVVLTSRGGAMFKQERIGQDGKRFYVHKFRSMYSNNKEKFGIDWSTDEKKDPRITPIGRFIRNTNLDELPQLFDVLFGTMSLVGPRPEQPKYVEKFSQEIPDYLRRHNVKSGLTGWAQINGLRGDTSIPERVKYDIYYMENWTIWFDIRIILGTFTYILKRTLAE